MEMTKLSGSLRALLGCGAVLAASCLVSTPALAQSKASAAIPKGPGSLSGVWVSPRFSNVFKADEGLGGVETGGRRRYRAAAAVGS